MSIAIWWLVLGLLIGWVIEWVIDWAYWRQRRQAVELDAQAARQAEAERAQMRDALASARAENERLQAKLSTTTALAQQRQVKIDELEERFATVRAEANELKVDMQAPEVPLAAAIPSTTYDNAKSAGLSPVEPLRENMAFLTPLSEQPAAGEPDTDGAQRLLEREVAQLAARPRDPLIDINGIGPVFERKLFDAGVYTFENLAALTPEQVRAIISPQRWQEIDPASWIAEARQLAQKKK